MDEEDDLPVSTFEPSPKMVQSMAEMPLGTPSVPEAPDMSGFSRPMPRPTDLQAQPPEQGGVVPGTDTPDPDALMPVTSFSGEGEDEELPVSTFEGEDALPIDPEKAIPLPDSLAPVASTADEDLPVSSFTDSYSQADYVNDPEKLATIRQYMVQSFGEQNKNKPADQLVDEWVSHNRWFENNEVTTVAEMRRNMYATPEERDITKKSYNLYGDLSSVFTNNGVSGAIGGMKDYVAATVSAPSSWIGGLVGGKIGTKLMSTAAREAMLKTAVIDAFKVGGKEAATKVVVNANRQKAIVAAIAGTTIDAGSNVFQDLALQDSKMRVGAQDELSYGELGLSAAMGVIPGVLAGVPQVTRGISGLDRAAGNIQSSQRKRSLNASKTAGPKIAASIKASTIKLKQDLTSWRDAVASGKAINPDMVDMSNVTSWFFDANDENSLFRIIHDSGADIDLSDEAHFSSQLTDFARNLEPNDLHEINSALSDMGLNFGEMVDIVSAVQNQAGKNMNKASMAKQYAKAVAGASAEKAKLNTSIMKGVESLSGAEKDPKIDIKGATYLASLWRRMLISNPATSMLNMKGWGIVATARTAAETLHGGVVGMAGLANKMAGGNWGDKAIGQSKALFENQVFKLRTALDPYETFKGFQGIINNSPEKVQKEINNSVFGGVNAKGVPERYGFSPDNKIINGAEKVADAAAKYTLVKAQDVMTKTYSGIWQLDKLSRLEYGKGVDELIKDGQFHLITKDMWQSTLNQMNKDTMSADYTRGGGAINKLASVVEQISNAPGLGFIFPFGRFMNNNIATFVEYSPLAFAPLGSKIYKDIAAKDGYAVMEKATKAMVGTMALGTLFAYTKQEMEKGNAWWAHEEGDGTIVNYQNLAPASLFRIAARMARLTWDGDPIPPEMIKEFGDQLGIGQWSKQVGSGNALSDVSNWWSTADKSSQEAFQGTLNWAMEYAAGVGAGFTRPLDPLNDAVGMVTGSDVNTDRRQAKSGMDAVTQELTRYTNNFFAPFFGEGKTQEGAPVFGTPARSATGPAGDIRDPNPLGSIISRKEETPRTAIQQLLGEVNLPAFTFNSYTKSPEYDLFVNEHILPELNYRAKNLMNSPAWKHLPQYQKVSQARAILADAKDRINDQIQGGEIGGADARLRDAQRNWGFVPEADRAAAKKEYNLQDKPDRELSQMEIDVMKGYIEDHEKLLKHLRE